MSKPWKGFLVLFACMLSSSAFASEYQPGEVIVKYKNGVIRTRAAMNVLYNDLGVQKVRRYHGIMSGVEQLVIGQKNADVQAAIAQLESDPAVEYAQPNYILYAQPVVANRAELAQIQPMGVPCIFPGIPFPPGCEDEPSGERPEVGSPPAEMDPPVADPAISQAYGLTKIGAIEAWNTQRGDAQFIVADIDTGIDYNHEDLALNVWRNPSVSEKGDLVGYDFIHDDGLPFDDNGHGTHTSGTIGAAGGNGVGISGVAQRVAIMGLKFLSARGSGTTADAIRAIDYAVEHGAKVLSNSWGGRGDSENQALYEAIERARQADVLFVAAAGNDSSDNDAANPAYPAAFDNDNLIAVASTDENDNLSYFSNYGKTTTDLAAPGSNVYSTMPGNQYKALSGTSMACPHVAGAAALVWSQHPEWTYKQVKQRLLDTVDKIPALAEKTVTGGRLNVMNAL